MDYVAPFFVLAFVLNKSVDVDDWRTKIPIDSSSYQE